MGGYIVIEWGEMNKKRDENCKKLIQWYNLKQHMHLIFIIIHFSTVQASETFF
jgi:hypothetical protein